MKQKFKIPVGNLTREEAEKQIKDLMLEWCVYDKKYRIKQRNKKLSRIINI